MSFLKSALDPAGATTLSFGKIMKSTRITIGLAMAIYCLGPFIGLGHLSRDVQFFDDFDKAYKGTSYSFPLLSEALMPFGPLWWWSYITPIALGVAAGAMVRSPVSIIAQASILLISVMQLSVIIAVFEPYFFLTKRMGNFVPIYPLWPLIANLSLIGASIGLACYSVAKLIEADRISVLHTKEAEQDAPSNGGQRSNLNSGFRPRRG